LAVFILIFACLKTAFNEDHSALHQVLVSDFSDPVKTDDIKLFGLLFTPSFVVDGQAETADGLARPLRVFHIRIFT
jgi:hypothetical protein